MLYMKKRFRKGLIAFAITATIIPTIVFASENNEIEPLGAGEWDGLLNSEYGIYASRWVTTRPVNSGGGDIRVCMSGVNAGNTITVNIYEQDISSDDTVRTDIEFKGPKTGTSEKTCSSNIDVEKYVDGDFAEIYLKMKGKLESDTVRVYIDD